MIAGTALDVSGADGGTVSVTVAPIFSAALVLIAGTTGEEYAGNFVSSPESARPRPSRDADPGG